MSRDYWMTQRPAPIIDKLKQTVTLPALTANCGPTRGSVYLTTDLSNILANSPEVAIDASNGVTLDFYAKIYAGTNRIANIQDIDINRRIGLSFFDTNKLAVQAVGSGGSKSEIVTCNYRNAWHRYTLAYDATTRKVSFYLDNVLLYTTTALAAGTLLFPNGAIITLGGSYIIPTIKTETVGFFNEVRVWNETLSQDRVNATTSYRGTADTNLVYYARLRNVPASTSIIGAGQIGTASLLAQASTTEFPIIKYGSSFAVASYNFNLGHAISFKWPINPPAGTTGMLIARWTDNEGITQRRRLWDLDGVDIRPAPARYAGENMGSDINLELWNIDGEATCVLPSDLTLYISYCTNPTTSYDKTHQAAIAAPTVDTTLAEGFPLTPFPLQFNEQQTY